MNEGGLYSNHPRFQSKVMYKVLPVYRSESV